MSEGIRLYLFAVNFAAFMTGFTLRGSCEPDYQDTLKADLQNNVTITAEDVNKDGVADLVLRIGEQEQVYIKGDNGVYRSVQQVIKARIKETKESYSLKKAEEPYKPE